MTAPDLHGRSILLAEDEFFLAMDLEEELRKAGATVVGPAATVTRALELIAADDHIDAAVLDLNLGGEMAYPVAERLLASGVPVVFATGYNEGDIPDHLRGVPRCQKPVVFSQVVLAVSRAVRTAS